MIDHLLDSLLRDKRYETDTVRNELITEYGRVGLYLDPIYSWRKRVNNNNNMYQISDVYMILKRSNTCTTI